MHLAIVIAFVAGFAEMLVGDSLTRAVIKDSGADEARTAAQQAQRETEATEHNPRGRKDVERNVPEAPSALHAVHDHEAGTLTWLPEALLSAGLKVAKTDRWKTRGRTEMGTVHGVMLHHTGTVAPGNMPSLGKLMTGRKDLPGPLCHLGLGRDGTYYVVAAGRANHAGAGAWRGITTGNASFIGIEAENGGRDGDDWPHVQLDAYRRGVAALLGRIGVTSAMCCAHREYALPAGRKIDPLFNMDAFRRQVDDIMLGTVTVPQQIPAADGHGRRTLTRGARGDTVRTIQDIVGVPADGRFGPRTEAAVRVFQRESGIVPDGIAGPETWAKILK
jgi:N-acetyl-anhydromuramyl-L-alanine amidase AmpD